MHGTSGASLSELLSRMAAVQLADWHGLPGNLHLGDARPWLDADEVPVSLTLGEDDVAARMLHLADPAPGAATRAWLHGDRDRAGDVDGDRETIVMVDMAVKGNHPATPSSLPGQPDARLDTRYGLRNLAGGEWVFADRGLALIVNVSNNAILHVIAFTPTTVADYVRTLRPSFETRRRSLRRDVAMIDG